MALNITSAAVSNQTAQPSIITNRGVGGGAPLVQQQINIPIATGNLAINSLIYALPLPSTAKLTNLELINDVQLDTNGTPLLTLDVGIYSLNFDGTFTAQAATVYASAVAFGSVAGTKLELVATGATGTRALTKVGQTVALDAGVTMGSNDLLSGNSIEPVLLVLVIKIHAAAATAQAGNLLVRANYVE